MRFRNSLWLALIAVFCLTGHAQISGPMQQAPKGGIDTPQVNHIIICDAHYASISACITAAGTSYSVIVPYGQHASDTFSNPGNVLDLRTTLPLSTAGGSIFGNLTLNGNLLGMCQTKPAAASVPLLFFDSANSCLLTQENTDGSTIVIGGSQSPNPSYTTVTLSGPITNATQAATKAYVDSQSASWLGGGVMTGSLTLNADPTSALQAATKEYVDSHIGNGGTVYPAAGIPVSNGNGWNTSLAAPNSALVGVTDVQTLLNKTIDGVSPTTMSFMDATSSIQNQFNQKAPLASPNFTGIPTAPTAALTINNTQIATTSFVQSLVQQATANLISATGGTMSGVLTLSDSSPAASQAWVTTAISGLTGTTGEGGGTTTTNQQLDSKVTSASAWNKICTPSGGQTNTPDGKTTVSCNGTTGNPVSTDIATSQNSPILNNVGVTGKAAVYGLTTNITSETDILVPTTVGTNYQATVFKREQWFTAGSNLAGVLNWENDIYMFDKPDDMEYMFGWQCNIKNTGFWQYDNFGGGWKNTAVPCTITSGHIYHWILWMHRDPATATNCTIPQYTYYDSSNTPHTVAAHPGPCEYWDTFQLDDQTAGTSNTYTLNAKYYAEPGEMGAKSSGSWPGWTTWSGIGSQVQLDVKDSAASASNPQLVSMNVDDDSLTTYVPVQSTGSGTQSVTETTGNLGEYDFDGSSPLTGLTCSGSPLTDTTLNYTSPNALQFNAASQYCTAPLSTAESGLFARFLLNVTTAATSNSRLLELDNSSGTQMFSLFLQGSNGVLTASNSATALSTGCSTGALSTGVWHTIELNWIEGATTGGFQVKVDNTSTCNVTATNTGTAPVGQVKFGSPSSTATPPWTVDIDNFGLSSTTWLGGVTVNTESGGSPLYDLYGAAATVAQSSLQDAKNLSDLTNPGAALANLLANPAPGVYSINCITTTNCGIQAGNSGSMVYPAGNGLAVVSGGNSWGTTVAAPVGPIVGTTDPQSLTNKTIDGITPTIMSYLANVSGDLQSQINSKQPSMGFTAVPNTTQINGHTLNANVTITASDLGLGALPNGVTASTQSAGDNSTKLATDAFVAAALAGITSGGASTPATNNLLKGTGVANGVIAATPGSDYVLPSGNITGSAASLSTASALPSGTTATTQGTGDNSTKVATDAFVAAAVAGLGGSGNPTPQTLSGATPAITTAAFQFITLSANATPTITVSLGERMTIEICQPSSGGPYTWAWPAAVHGGMTIGQIAGTCSIQSFVSFNGSTLVPDSTGVINVAP